MSKIRWFFVRFALGVGLFAGVTGAPVKAEVPAYLVSRHQIAVPNGAQTLCKTYVWACSTSAEGSEIKNTDMRLVKKINSKINRLVPQIEDFRQYRKSEVWALPTRKGGDCEDFALLKKRDLIAAGIPADRLFIATVLDRRMRGHAVLVVRSPKGDVVLDNLTNRILSWDKTGYLFLKMQSPSKPGQWDSILAGGRLLNRTNRG